MRPLIILAIVLAAVVTTVAGVLLLFLPVYTETSGSPVPIMREGGLEGYNQTVVYINNVGLLADIADTQEKKTVGLGVRDTMDEGEAMLFPFESEGRHSFWMQGMKFPIDIIWLDSDKTVIHIEHSLQPCTPLNCPSYQPDRDAKYVLETVAGFSEKWGVREGTGTEFHLE